MKIAAQLYTLREYCKTPAEIYETLKKVKAIGYNSVQVSGIGEIEPKLLKQYVDELGLTICVTHNPFGRIVEDTDRLIEEHKLYDCNYIGLGSMPGEYAESLEKCQEFLDVISPAVEKIAKAGMKFTYHNHQWEFTKYNGQTLFDYMAAHTQDAFTFLVDTYWVQYGGTCPAKLIEQHAGRIDIVHYKDMEIVDRAPRMAPVGEGNLNWKEITDACEKAGVKIAAVEQDQQYRDAFDCMRSSYEYMKNTLGLE